jgi:hypothetical protein
MSTTLQSINVALTISGTSPLPSANAAFASYSVVVTDSSGTAQPAVVLTGVETPTAWAFNTSVNPGAGSVTATGLDANGLAIAGASMTQAFSTSSAAGTFPTLTGIVVTANPAGTAATPAAASATSAFRR